MRKQGDPAAPEEAQRPKLAVDIDDIARKQLRDDILVLEGELALVKALLVEIHDWDSEFRRLLRDELPPLDED